MKVKEMQKILDNCNPEDQIYIQDPEEFYLRKIEDIYPVYQSTPDIYFKEEDELPKKEIDKFKKSLVITCKDHV